MEFIILILIYLVIGIPIYKWCENFIVDKGTLSLIGYSIVLGFMGLNLFELILGHFGLQLNGINNSLYKIGLAFLLYGSLLINCGFSCFKLNFNFSKFRPSPSDVLISTVFTAFFIISFTLINKTYYIPWDVFHYWLLDPKIIFETGYLRDSTDLIDMHSDYGSYLSVAINDLYLLFGEVRERPAAYFTQLHAFFAFLIIAPKLYKLEIWHKLLSFSILLIVLSSFAQSHWFFTNYTEVQCAFYLMLFVNFLIFTSPKNYSDYLLRAVLLITTLYILGNIKPYWPQVIFLVLVWVLFDFKNKVILKDFRFNLIPTLLFITLIFLIYFSDYYYHTYWISEYPNTGNAASTNNIITRILDLASRTLSKIIPDNYDDAKSIYESTDSRFDRFIPYYTLLFLSISGIILLDLKNRKTQFVLLSLVGIAGIYFLYVIFFFPVKDNDSFYRYATLFFFLIPLLFSTKYDDTRNRTSIKVISIIFSFLAVLHFLFASLDLKDMSKAKHSGKYQDFYQYSRFTELSDNIRSIIGTDNLFIVHGKGKIHVRQKSVLMLRYALLENVVGGIRYQTKDIESFKKFLIEHNVKYLLVVEPDFKDFQTLLDIKHGNYEKDNIQLYRVIGDKKIDFKQIQLNETG